MLKTSRVAPQFHRGYVQLTILAVSAMAISQVEDAATFAEAGYEERDVFLIVVTFPSRDRPERRASLPGDLRAHALPRVALAARCCVVVRPRPRPLVARYGGIDELRPGVDPSAKIVKMAEPLAAEVLRGVLTAYAVMALEHDRRTPIQTTQCIVIRLIKQARAVELREGALVVRPDID